MNSVTIDVKSDAKASRIELFVRIVWYIISAIVLVVLEIVAGICFVLQWLVILITGKRNMSLNGVIRSYLTYAIKFISYILLLTDERNPIIPTDKQMATVKFEVKSDAKASRIELFVRIVWYILSAIVLAVIGIIAAICLVIQWFVILITGKRNMSLNGIVKAYVIYFALMTPYVFLLTDERNPIIPK